MTRRGALGLSALGLGARGLGALWAASAVALLASGCGGPAPIPVLPAPSASSSPAPPPTSPPPFPARPSVLDLARVNPCHLLTARDLAELGVELADYSPDSDGQRSPACRWDSRRDPGPSWLIRAVTARGAQAALPGTGGAAVTRVSGYGAVRTTAPAEDPDRNCVLVVDVAPGQSLAVQFDTPSGDPPGATREAACAQATKVAEMAVRNLAKR